MYKALKNLLANVLTVAVVVGGGYGVFLGLNYMSQKEYIVGDPVSEHIAKCEECSREWAIVHECAEAMRVKQEYQRKAK